LRYLSKFRDVFHDDDFPEKLGKTVGFFVLFLGMFALFAVLSNSKQADKYLVEVQKEFAAITPPPGAISHGTNSGTKMGQAAIGAKYDSDLPMAKIISAYDSQLKSHGWVQASNQPSTDWGRDTGGRVLYYRKGGFWAILESTGNGPLEDYTYDFTITSSDQNLSERAGSKGNVKCFLTSGRDNLFKTRDGQQQLVQGAGLRRDHQG
jgi:hypothetical protein